MRDAVELSSQRRSRGTRAAHALLRTGNRCSDSVLGGLAGLGERVVTRVEIFPILDRGLASRQIGCIQHAHLLHFGQDILVRREFAVQTKELLLLLREFLFVERNQ